MNEWMNEWMNDFLTSHHVYKTWQLATVKPCDTVHNYVTVTTLQLGCHSRRQPVTVSLIGPRSLRSSHWVLQDRWNLLFKIEWALARAHKPMVDMCLHCTCVYGGRHRQLMCSCCEYLWCVVCSGLETVKCYCEINDFLTADSWLWWPSRWLWLCQSLT